MTHRVNRIDNFTQVRPNDWEELNRALRIVWTDLGLLKGKSSGHTALTDHLDFDDHRGINAADPVNDSDLVTKGYADRQYGTASFQTQTVISGGGGGVGGGSLTGSGTLDTITKWSSASGLTDSSITDDGTDVTVTASGSFIFSGITPTVNLGALSANWASDGSKILLGTTSTHDFALKSDDVTSLWINTGGKVAIGGTAPDATTTAKFQMKHNQCIMRTGDATGGGQLINSNAFLLQGAYWNGSASVPIFWDIRMFALSTAPTYSLGILNNAGAEVFTLRESGLLTVTNIHATGLATANRVIYSNGSQFTSSANLYFDGTNFGVGGTASVVLHAIGGSTEMARIETSTGSVQIRLYSNNTNRGNVYGDSAKVGIGHVTGVSIGCLSGSFDVYESGTGTPFQVDGTESATDTTVLIYFNGSLRRAKIDAADLGNGVKNYLYLA